MNKKNNKFDCVKMMRDIRNKMDKEFEGLSIEERFKRINERVKESPIYKKFAKNKKLVKQ